MHQLIMHICRSRQQGDTAQHKPLFLFEPERQNKHRNSRQQHRDQVCGLFRRHCRKSKPQHGIRADAEQKFAADIRAIEIPDDNAEADQRQQMQLARPVCSFRFNHRLRPHCNGKQAGGNRAEHLFMRRLFGHKPEMQQISRRENQCKEQQPAKLNIGIPDLAQTDRRKQQPERDRAAQNRHDPAAVLRRRRLFVLAQHNAEIRQQQRQSSADCHQQRHMRGIDCLCVLPNCLHRKNQRKTGDSDRDDRLRFGEHPAQHTHSQRIHKEHRMPERTVDRNHLHRKYHCRDRHSSTHDICQRFTADKEYHALTDQKCQCAQQNHPRTGDHINRIREQGGLIAVIEHTRSAVCGHLCQQEECRRRACHAQPAEAAVCEHPVEEQRRPHAQELLCDDPAIGFDFLCKDCHDHRRKNRQTEQHSAHLMKLLPGGEVSQHTRENRDRAPDQNRYRNCVFHFQSAGRKQQRRKQCQRHQHRINITDRANLIMPERRAPFIGKHRSNHAKRKHHLPECELGMIERSQTGDCHRNRQQQSGRTGMQPFDRQKQHRKCQQHRSCCQLGVHFAHQRTEFTRMPDENLIHAHADAHRTDCRCCLRKPRCHLLFQRRNQRQEEQQHQHSRQQKIALGVDQRSSRQCAEHIRKKDKAVFRCIGNAFRQQQDQAENCAECRCKGHPPADIKRHQNRLFDRCQIMEQRKKAVIAHDAERNGCRAAHQVGHGRCEPARRTDQRRRTCQHLHRLRCGVQSLSLYQHKQADKSCKADRKRNNRLSDGFGQLFPDCLRPERHKQRINRRTEADPGSRLAECIRQRIDKVDICRRNAAQRGNAPADFFIDADGNQRNYRKYCKSKRDRPFV